MHELQNLRTSHAKTFDLGNGKRRLEASFLPVHYEENGVWKDVDMTLRNGKIRDGIYHVDLLDNAIGFKAIDRKTGNGIKIEFVGPYKNPTITDNVALWEDVLPGVDVKFIFRNHQAHIFRILKNDHAPKTSVWKVTEDSGDKTLFFNPKVTGRDANKRQTKHTTKYENGILTDTFDGKVFERDKKTRVKTEIDPVYPIEIDPTITINITDTVDDGYGHVAGTNTALRTNSPYNYLYNLKTTGTVGNTSQSCPFFRFLGVTIPQSSTVNSASLNLHVSFHGGAGPPDKITARAKLLNNPIAPTLGPQVVTPGTLATHNSVLTTVFSGGNTYGINVKNLVQELVNAFDYSNESMLFFIRTPRFTGTEKKYLGIDDFSLGGGVPAQLVIDYTAGGGGSSIKTWNGLADASVKTVNGLARASVKTRNGLA